jgi:AcrR family transcriptional regulator
MNAILFLRRVNCYVGAGSLIMAQIKKPEIREDILRAAEALFARHGYVDTTLAAIARKAGVTMSNIYNYFGSKLEILYAIYEPWLDERVARLAREAEAIANPRARLRHVLLAVLRDIPTANNGFANNVLQAISTRHADERYSRALLLRSEQRVSAMLRPALPPARRALLDNDVFAHLLFMAFDGFAVNYTLNGPSRRVEAIVDLLCNLLLGAAGGHSRGGHRAKRPGADAA